MKQVVKNELVFEKVKDANQVSTKSLVIDEDGNVLQKEASEDNVYIFRVGGSPPNHFHTIGLTFSEVTYMVENEMNLLNTVTKVSDEVNGHEHTVIFRYDSATNKIIVVSITSAGDVEHTCVLVGLEENYSENILILAQTGTLTPIVQFVKGKNTFTGARTDVGVYTLTLDGPIFFDRSTFLGGSRNIKISFINTNSWRIETFDDTGAPADNILYFHSFIFNFYLEA